jgi:hypothetical protein
MVGFSTASQKKAPPWPDFVNVGLLGFDGTRRADQREPPDRATREPAPMASPRQIAANVQNSSRSTGPTSACGKTRSRANSLKHGLAGEGAVLTPDDADAVARRKAEWRGSFRIADARDEWLFEQAVVTSVQIDHCNGLESALHANLARRAAVCWDEDRRLEAEETAVGLSKRPALVRQRLRQTAQGCEWMIERWAYLGGVIEEGGTWSEAQKALAFDLLGVDPVLRDIPLVEPEETGAELAAEQLEALRAYKAEALDELDGFERASAELGLPVTPCPALERLRRYKAACVRRHEWACARLGRPSREPVAAEDVPIAPAPVAPPAPAPAPVAEPPFLFDPGPVVDPLGEEDFSVIEELMALARQRIAEGGSRRPTASGPVQSAPGARPAGRPDRARMVDGA